MASIQNRVNAVDRIPIGRFPTPVRKISIGSYHTIWIKDDGVCSDLYGGNKIRKLEFLLADARAKGKKRLIVHGDTGSHNVMACSLYGRHFGFDVQSVVFSCREDDDARQSVPRLQAAGVTVTRQRNMLLTMLGARLLGLRRDSYCVPLGCSSPLTTIGYVIAAMELRRQIDEGQMPMPGKIFIAHATGGSVAGLLIGLAITKTPARIVAVQTAERVIAGHAPLQKLVHRTLDLLDGPRSLFTLSMEHLHKIESVFMGAGYRDTPEESLSAVQWMKERGVFLEPVFTGKAAAALLAEARTKPKEQLLFWNTHDQPYRQNGHMMKGNKQ